MFGGRRRGAIEQSHAGLEPGDLRNMAALFYQDRGKETASANAAIANAAIMRCRAIRNHLARLWLYFCPPCHVQHNSVQL